MPAFFLKGSLSSALLGLGSPGLMLMGTGAKLLGTAEIDLDFVPTNFLVERAVEGPQVLISWGNPSNATAYPYRYELRRGARYFPLRKKDGFLVQSGTADGDIKISDRASMLSGQIYYYSLFVEDTSQVESPPGDEPWYTHPAIQGHTLSIETGYWRTRMFDLLPNIFRIMDGRPDLGGLFGQTKLAEVTGTALTGRESEVFNFGEDSSVPQGQLQRFLKLPGVMFDEARRLIEHHIKDLTAAQAHPHLLRFLASNIGWVLNEEVPLRSQRLEVDSAVHYYKRKTSAAGIETQAKSSGGVHGAYASEVRDSVLLTNDPSKAQGSHDVGRSVVQLPTADALVVSSANAPNLLSKRPLAMQFFGGRGATGYPPGHVFFAYAEDTPDTRQMMLFPGEFTVEFWLRVNQWPQVPSSTPAIPTSNVEVEASVVGASYQSGATGLFTLYLRTIRDTVGNEIHTLDVETGAFAGPSRILHIPEIQGGIVPGEAAHVSVSRRVLKGPGFGSPLPSPEAVDTEWTVYVNGTAYEAVQRESGDHFLSTLGGTDAIFVGPEATISTAQHRSDFVIDQLRCWRVARTAAELLAAYGSKVNGHSPGMVVHAMFDDNQVVPALDGLATADVVQDTSSVEGHGGYSSPTSAVASPLSRAGDAARYVGPVADDPFIVDNIDDELRRRDRQQGMREGFVVSEKFHLRRVRLNAFTSRRRNG